MNFPTLVGEVIGREVYGRPCFAFKPWADGAKFEYPDAAREFMARCGSAAEAYFVRPFCCRAGIEFLADGSARAGQFTLRLQVPAATYWVDAVLSNEHSTLAIEIDGMQFHHHTKEQVAADYLRQRRLVLKGFTVVRFTAREAFAEPDECWRQLEAIMLSRRNQ